MANDYKSANITNDLMTNDPMTNKKYILKPGNHQFAPGSHAVHNNNNLNDEEAEWYLEKYPHITQLFIPQNSGEKTVEVPANLLTPHSGDWGTTV